MSRKSNSDALWVPYQSILSFNTRITQMHDNWFSLHHTIGWFPSSHWRQHQFSNEGMWGRSVCLFAVLLGIFSTQRRLVFATVQPITASFVICVDARTVLDTWKALLMKSYQDYTFRSLCWNLFQWFLDPWLIDSQFLSMTDVWLAANFSQAPCQYIKEACVARFMVCVGLKFIGWWFGFKSSFHLIKDTSISFPSSRAKHFYEIHGLQLKSIPTFVRLILCASQFTLSLAQINERAYCLH